ncbi:MAG: hypothetical protein M0037_00175 [Betaproteobacteria bacterium]|nr:hypothetical protein [Betaproteobacteria bacterium]
MKWLEPREALLKIRECRVRNERKNQRMKAQSRPDLMTFFHSMKFGYCSGIIHLMKFSHSISVLAGLPRSVQRRSEAANGIAALMKMLRLPAIPGKSVCCGGKRAERGLSRVGCSRWRGMRP